MSREGCAASVGCGNANALSAIKVKKAVEPRVRVVRASPEQSTFRGVPGTQSFFGGSATCHGRDAPQVWVGATQML